MLLRIYLAVFFQLVERRYVAHEVVAHAHPLTLYLLAETRLKTLCTAVLHTEGQAVAHALAQDAPVVHWHDDNLPIFHFVVREPLDGGYEADQPAGQRVAVVDDHLLAHPLAQVFLTAVWVLRQQHVAVFQQFGQLLGGLTVDALIAEHLEEVGLAHDDSHADPRCVVLYRRVKRTAVVRLGAHGVGCGLNVVVVLDAVQQRQPVGQFNVGFVRVRRVVAHGLLVQLVNRHLVAVGVVEACRLHCSHYHRV